MTRRKSGKTRNPNDTGARRQEQRQAELVFPPQTRDHSRQGTTSVPEALDRRARSKAERALTRRFADRRFPDQRFPDQCSPDQRSPDQRSAAQRSSAHCSAAHTTRLPICPEAFDDVSKASGDEVSDWGLVEAVAVLLATVVFGLGWAVIELDRVEWPGSGYDAPGSYGSRATSAGRWDLAGLDLQAAPRGSDLSLEVHSSEMDRRWAQSQTSPDKKTTDNVNKYVTDYPTNSTTNSATNSAPAKRSSKR